MNVVHHGPGDIVDTCMSFPKQCERRKLSQLALALYRTDHKKLATKVAAAIGSTEQHELIKGQTVLRKFGFLNLQAGHGAPVYCQCLDPSRPKTLTSLFFSQLFFRKRTSIANSKKKPANPSF